MALTKLQAWYSYQMDKPKVTPKDFFLWIGTMVALYVGVFNYIALVWAYIDYVFPDPLQYYSGDPYQSGISWEMATLIVVSPTFLFLMWFIHREIKRDPSRATIWIRRWALYLTLFVAAVSIAVDLIFVLYAFLNGIDITTRFLLKALVVLFVAAVGFMHFIADLWGYWDKFPARNRSVAYATGALVAITIVAGFFIVGTPQQARLYRLDARKVNDLQNIQSQVVSYWQAKRALPASLADLNSALNGFSVPTDPQSGDAYDYRATGMLAFELCAEFNAQMQSNTSTAEMTRAEAPYPMGVKGSPAQESWQHGVGKACFERTIDPAFYPPLNQKTP